MKLFTFIGLMSYMKGKGKTLQSTGMIYTMERQTA